MKHSRKKLPPLGEGWGGASGWMDGLSVGWGGASDWLPALPTQKKLCLRAVISGGSGGKVLTIYYYANAVGLFHYDLLAIGDIDALLQTFGAGIAAYLTAVDGVYLTVGGTSGGGQSDIGGLAIDNLIGLARLAR